MSDDLIPLSRYQHEAKVGLTFYALPAVAPDMLAVVEFEDGATGSVRKHGIRLQDGHPLLDLLAAFRTGQRDHVVGVIHCFRSPARSS